MARQVLLSSASVLEVPGKRTSDTGDFDQKDIAGFDLRSKDGRSCRHADQYIQLGMGFLDRAKRISKRAIKGGIRAIDDFPHLSFHI